MVSSLIQDRGIRDAATHGGHAMPTADDVTKELQQLRERVAKLEAQANRPAWIAHRGRPSCDPVLVALTDPELMRRLEIPQHTDDDD